MTGLQQRFLEDVLRNPCNRALLEGLPEMGLADAWLVGGCLFQTVWNLLSDRLPQAGIRDYDIFYFDPDDLSETTEQAVEERARARFAELGIVLEVKNQARVHTWYEAYFGRPCPPLRSACEGVDRFLVGSTSVAVHREAGAMVLHAPYGLDDLYSGVLTPNPTVDHGPLYERKSRDYQARWAWLRTPETFKS
ncbi:nucleotidyltransferase family protein [Polaromonas sp. A23]|uniref:nucleotidyltransferase family protein n=1 Tax=Polaromonas sp. A23 TaxID=1944133 RepID=UPI0020C383D9|nr:nucleotidyltransferase family protein [Polaromonas sp. A23]